MQPRVKKHAAVAARENKDVAVDPARLGRIIFQRVTEEHCTDFRAAEWKPKMSRLRRLHGVHAQTTRLVCSFRKNFNVQTHARFLFGFRAFWKIGRMNESRNPNDEWRITPECRSAKHLRHGGLLRHSCFVVSKMNQTTLLQIAEKLERLAGRLPSKIQKAVLSELTPFKELFLQQRPPRFLLIGSSTIPMPRILNALFSPDAHEQMNRSEERRVGKEGK